MKTPITPTEHIELGQRLNEAIQQTQLILQALERSNKTPKNRSWRERDALKELRRARRALFDAQSTLDNFSCDQYDAEWSPRWYYPRLLAAFTPVVPPMPLKVVE